MQESFAVNYLKIYFWRGCSIFLNLAAVVLVIPKLTDYGPLFGIYSVCVSVAVYLNYADLGFLKAGLKYASEYFALGDRKKEQQYIGFSLYVLCLFVVFLSASFFFLSIYPDFLLKDLSLEERRIASELFCIQAVFSFNVVLKRFVDSVLDIRLESYLSQRVRILVGVIKIALAYFFFTENRYDIVNYFVACHLVDSIGYVKSICQIRKKYSYDLLFQVRCIRYDSSLFNRVKGLAFGSFYGTVTWIAFYELDQVVISKLFGATSVALYAVAFTLLTYYRTLMTIIFSPFQARLNHLIGLGNFDEIKQFFLRIIRNTMPFVVFSVVSFLILADSFIMSWVGLEYENSIPVARLLVASSILLFLSIPASYMIVALEKVKELYYINTLQVLVFWVGIILTIQICGINSFSLFKLVASLLVGLYSLKIAITILDMKIIEFLEKTIFKIIFPIFCQILILLIAKYLMQDYTTNIGLGWVILMGSASMTLALLVYYFIDREIRDEFKSLILSLKKRKFEKV